MAPRKVERFTMDSAKLIVCKYGKPKNSYKDNVCIRTYPDGSAEVRVRFTGRNDADTDVVVHKEVIGELSQENLDKAYVIVDRIKQERKDFYAERRKAIANAASVLKPPKLTEDERILKDKLVPLVVEVQNNIKLIDMLGKESLTSETLREKNQEYCDRIEQILLDHNTCLDTDDLIQNKLKKWKRYQN